MKKIIYLILPVLLIAVILGGCSSQGAVKTTPITTPAGTAGQPIADTVPAEPAAEPGSLSVAIMDFAYTPGELTVKVGETVTWTNQDSMAHTVTSDSGIELDSELFGQGESYSHTFAEAGEYAYYCKPHPFMKGKIIVIE
ncbi:MAG: plastocyanin/azurin family copper-binding protein [Planctomycetes bacterium]|jgi:amicyanin|nr:plastocyanin/azurin family copper-binding protein [Planctomycetota bacterium]